MKNKVAPWLPYQLSLSAKLLILFIDKNYCRFHTAYLNAFSVSQLTHFERFFSKSHHAALLRSILASLTNSFNDDQESMLGR